MRNFDWNANCSAFRMFAFFVVSYNATKSAQFKFAKISINTNGGKSTNTNAILAISPWIFCATKKIEFAIKKKTFFSKSNVLFFPTQQTNHFFLQKQFFAFFCKLCKLLVGNVLFPFQIAAKCPKTIATTASFARNTNEAANSLPLYDGLYCSAQPVSINKRRFGISKNATQTKFTSPLKDDSNSFERWLRFYWTNLTAWRF